MNMLCKNIEQLGIPLNTYHIIHEGFWDLYCKKPQSPELNVRKLEGWINRINLISSGPGVQIEGQMEGDDQMEEEQEVEEEKKEEEVEAEANQEQSPEFQGPPKPDVKAIVRIRIPFKRPEIEPVEGEEASQKDPDDQVRVDEQGPLEEIEYEDKILTINTQGADYNILVVH